MQFISGLKPRSFLATEIVIFDDDRLQDFELQDCGIQIYKEPDPILDLHLVKTSWEDGIEDKHINAALTVLGYGSDVFLKID